tara:strand:- start:541724 stop:543079 length:1356 start_codon:yes stop_codon:yes gene_type:complete
MNSRNSRPIRNFDSHDAAALVAAAALPAIAVPAIAAFALTLNLFLVAPSAQADERGKVDVETTASGQSLAGPRELSRAFRAAARKATPAVVTVYSYGQNLPDGQATSETGAQTGPTPPQRLGDDSDGLPITGIGSGVIVSPEGLVITNNHVIADARKVKVQFSDDTEIVATNVHGDPDSDVATLQIEREEPFPYAEIGDSDALEIGDWVLAIGSPFRLEATVSAGIISAKNRTLERINRGRLIQTDAAINPGNSGGPLIDLDGNVIAINTAIATRNGTYQGIGFAIPINQAKWIADELSKHGLVRRAAIGLTMAELKPKIAAMFKLQPGIGVLAYEVIEGSAAERAGIEPIDVIIEFAGERVRDPGSLREAIERQPVGSSQDIKVLRDGQEIELKVTLATREDPTLGKPESQASDDETDASKKDTEASEDEADASEKEAEDEPSEESSDPA